MSRGPWKSLFFPLAIAELSSKNMVSILHTHTHTHTYTFTQPICWTYVQKKAGTWGWEKIHMSWVKSLNIWKEKVGEGGEFAALERDYPKDLLPLSISQGIFFFYKNL